MNYRKVYGGTPVGNTSRCDTCIHAIVVQGYSESDRITMCDVSWRPIHIPFPVAECSKYGNRCLPDFEEMEKIAIPIEPKTRVPVRGFAVTDLCEIK